MGGLKSLLMAMLVMVLGAYLIAPVNSAVSVIVTPTYGASVVSLSALLPLLFIIVIIWSIFQGFMNL